MDFDVQMAKTAATVDAAARMCKSPALEPKYDGHRTIMVVTAQGVRVFNGRSRKEYTGQIPEIQAELAKLPVGTILDGELVAIGMTDEGLFTNDFKLVGKVMSSDVNGKKYPPTSERLKLQYVAFDLISSPGEAGMERAELSYRREALAFLLQAHGISTAFATVSLQLEATQKNHDDLVALGFEGSIVKDMTQAYGFGKRGHGWHKIKSVVTVDVVVMDLPVNGEGRNENLVGHIVWGQVKDGVLTERGHCNPLDDAMRLSMTQNPEQWIGRCFELKVYGWDADTDGPRHPTFQRMRDDKTVDQCPWRND